MKTSPIEATLPLSPLQEGLLFHSLYDQQGVDVYNVQFACALTGPLDPARMRAACEALLGRHAALRAGFVQRRSAQTIQAVAREVNTPWTDIDLTDLDGTQQEDRVGELLADDRLNRFDMTHPPLARFTLIRLADERHVLAFTFHHILLDGWSGMWCRAPGWCWTRWWCASGWRHGCRITWCRRR